MDFHHHKRVVGRQGTRAEALLVALDESLDRVRAFPGIDVARPPQPEARDPRVWSGDAVVDVSIAERFEKLRSLARELLPEGLVGLPERGQLLRRVPHPLQLLVRGPR